MQLIIAQSDIETYFTNKVRNEIKRGDNILFNSTVDVKAYASWDKEDNSLHIKVFEQF